MKKLYIKIKESRATFYIAGSLVLLISLLFTFLRYSITVERFISAITHLKNSFVHYFKVTWLKKANYGTYYGPSESVSFLKVLDFLPFDVDKVIFKFQNLWEAMLIKENFQNYTFDFVIFSIKALIYAVSSFIVLVILDTIFDAVYMKYKHEPVEDPEGNLIFEPVEDSSPLVFFKAKIVPVLSFTWNTIKNFCVRFYYSKFWNWFFLIWFFNFNFFSIISEFLAWAFGFSIAPSANYMMSTIGTILLDLIITFASAPWWVWLVLGYVIFDIIRKNIGKDKRDRLYRKCIGFLKSLAFNVLFEAETGGSKSKSMVQAAIMTDDYFHSDQWDTLYEVRQEYPDFPYDKLEADIESQIEEHLIYSPRSVREFIHCKMSEYFKNPVSKNIWNYEGRMYYNDGYRYCNIWENLNDYAQCYYIYTADTTAILANISIRTDLKKVRGYFPLWDNDMLNREPELYEDYTRFCHIADQDAFRFDKTIKENNPNAYAIEYGINCSDEIDKDRGNQYSNKEYKIDDENANPLNDGYANSLMFERHYLNIRFKSYRREYAVVQRSDNFNAKENQMFDKLFILSKSETLLTMPLFFEDKIYSIVNGWYQGFSQSIFHYGQNRTLLFYILEHTLVPFLDYCRKIKKLYGYEHCKVSKSKACNRDAAPEVFDWYLIHMICHNWRYASDAFNCFIDEAAKYSRRGLIDITSYRGIKSEFDEMPELNSYFANRNLKRIEKIKKHNKNFIGKR
ncbi:MAG: hypothetical protein J6A53_03150 [Clostridia bacterium]|nr:hypothetical protein [Clostridia bacterium]